MKLEHYRNRYEHVRMSRTDGILEVVLHSGGESLVWGTGPHRELPEAFADIASDRENRVVVLTGAGSDFCAARDDTLSQLRRTATGWDRILWEGARLLENLLAIDVPVIAAVNGPVRYHAELPLLSDIVLASDTVVFQDRPHFPSGVVPGDGVQTVWPMLLGPNRGRYFLLTGQELDAEAALALGLVGEVLPAERLMDRAREHARDLAARPVLALRYTRAVLTERIKRALADELRPGLALEGLALLSLEDRL